MLIVVIVFTAGQIFSAVSASYGMLVVARICVACAHAVFWSIAAPIAIRVVSEDHRHAAMGIVVMGSSVALIAGLPLGRMIGLALGWRMTFLCVAIVAAVILIYLKMFLPQLPATSPFSVRELPSLIRTPSLRGIYVLIALVMTGYYTCYSYIEPFLLQSAHLDESIVTGAIALFGIAGIVGSLLFSKLYVRLRLRFLLVAIVGLALALAALYSGATSLPTVALICAVLGLCATALNVALQSEVIRCSDLDAQAVATSIYSGIFNLGIGCGSALGGAVVSDIGMAYIGFVAAILVTMSVVYYVLVLKPRLSSIRVEA